MNLTASLKRAVFVSCGCMVLPVLSACVGTVFDGSGFSSSDSGDVQQTALTGVTDGTSESSRVLVGASPSGLGVDFVDGLTSNQLLIHVPADKGNVTYEVSRLDSPSRLVLDLYGVGGVPSRTVDTSDSQYVSRIRFGAYSDKTRIVLDLNKPEGIEHSIDNVSSAEGENGKEIRVTLTSPNGTNTVAAASDNNIQGEEPKAAFAPESDDSSQPAADSAIVENTIPTEQIIPVDTTITADNAAPAVQAEQELVIDTSSNSKESEKVVEALNDTAKAQPAATEVLAKPNTETLPSLSSMEIQELGTSDNILILQLSSDKALADLKQTAPSEYILNLKGATLAETAANTLIAPTGSGAIRSARPVARGDNVEIRIFTSPENNLSLSGGPGRLIVSANKIGADSEARAQMNDKTAAKEKAVEDATAAPLDEEVSSLLQDQPKYSGRVISLDLQDTDIDNALRIIAEVSNLNIIASQDVAGKVTLRLNNVPWDQALDVILKTNGLDKVQEGNVIRIAPVEKLRLERESLKQAQQAEEDLEPLTVRYVRISYAKAAEMKALVESVLTERGNVTYDERTNQLIIKDIKKGIKNVAELVAKLDLRTPQVLLETQIVEASRSLLRELGSEVGFNYVQSPATGNATGYNFPNSINVNGSLPGGSAVSFPAAVSDAGGTAVSFLLDSADGTKSLSARLTALETEGKVKIVSRPSVATTNNKQATIKSVEKIRIKTPSGGLSVATGQGASASGSSTTATEVVEIGIVLEVTPQASPDYFVLLDINAKSSTFGTHPVEGIPSEVERSATSSVLVSSGQTFAMGGIYKISDTDSISGVPFFKDIPFLGHLFRWQKIDGSDEELLFFLTPRIIEGSFDDAAMKNN